LPSPHCYTYMQYNDFLFTFFLLYYLSIFCYMKKCSKMPTALICIVQNVFLVRLFHVFGIVFACFHSIKKPSHLLIKKFLYVFRGRILLMLCLKLFNRSFLHHVTVWDLHKQICYKWQCDGLERNGCLWN